jgi:hypothetical protein
VWGVLTAINLKSESFFFFSSDTAMTRMRAEFVDALTATGIVSIPAELQKLSAAVHSSQSLVALSLTAMLNTLGEEESDAGKKIEYEDVWQKALSTDKTLLKEFVVAEDFECLRCSTFFGMDIDKDELKKLDEPQLQAKHIDPKLRDHHGKRYWASSHFDPPSRLHFDVNPKHSHNMYLDAGLFADNQADTSLCDAIYEFKLGFGKLRSVTQQGRHNLGQGYSYGLKVLDLRPTLEWIRVCLYSIDAREFVQMIVYRDRRVEYSLPHLVRSAKHFHGLVEWMAAPPALRKLPPGSAAFRFLGRGASAAAFLLADGSVFKSYHEGVSQDVKEAEQRVLEAVTAAAPPPTIVKLVEAVLPLGFRLSPQFRRIPDWLEITQQQMADLLLVLKWLHDLSYAYQEIHSENIMLNEHGQLSLVDLGCAQQLGLTATWRGSLWFCGEDLLSDLEQGPSRVPKREDDLIAFVQFAFFTFRPHHQAGLQLMMKKGHPVSPGIYSVLRGYWSAFQADAWLALAHSLAARHDYSGLQGHLLRL